MQTTQFDHHKRVVSLCNLRAMCARISGTCHRFAVESVGASTVRVSYSNPDEYGRAEPVTAVFPCYKGTGNTAVVLDAIRYVNSPDEEWQAFWQLFDCPALFRVSSDRDQWQSEYEILIARANNENFRVMSSWDKGGCIQTWHCNGQDFRSFADAEKYAVEAMKAALRIRERVASVP